MGTPPDAMGWRIAISRGEQDTVLVLASGAVSSSGPSMQSIAGVDGSRESHVVAATGSSP